MKLVEMRPLMTPSPTAYRGEFELFVNLEPSVLGPDTATRLLDRAAGQAGIVVEITERALLHRPAELLRGVHQLR